MKGHEGRTLDLTTPRQYTAHGGWNESCECGFLLGDAGGEGGYERIERRHQEHIAALTTPAPRLGGEREGEVMGDG